MEKEKKQFKVLLDILETFHSAGILQEMMLIGSWCFYFYRLEFENAFTAVRTLDVDFLIPHYQHLKKEVDVPALLKGKGFVPTFNRSSGIVVYDHEELRVEFLVPELGRGDKAAYEVKKLHVKAAALRYLNLLMNHPRVVSYERLNIKVPEPAVFALHKLIVSERRSNKEKSKKDLEMAISLLEFLFSRPDEVRRIQLILKTIPKKWLKTMLSISAKHFPRLNEMMEDFQS